MSSPDNPVTTDEPLVSLEAEKLLQAGLAASQANDSAAAVRLFELASASSPNHPLPQFLLGSELASLARIDEAESAFANAVLLAPAFDLARYQLGLLQFSSGRTAAALVSWQPLFALREDNALFHFVRGFAALAQDESDAARTHFNDGILRNTENAPLTADIRKVLERMDIDVEAAPCPRHAQPAPEADAEANHILIANYGKLGTVH